jgi:beta-lactamase class D
MQTFIPGKSFRKNSRYLLAVFFCWYITIQAQTVNVDQLLSNCKVKGSVTLYDYHAQRWLYSNEQDAHLATLPASTFKIINSLIALETKVIKDENEVITWDGVDRGWEVWNADTDLKNAFKNSTIWFYQEIARRVGKKRYKKYLNKSGYGNQTIGEEVDKFWINGALQVSPVEQINFLIKLYENKLPFAKKNQEKVKEIMVYETADNYILRAKTGWGFSNETNIGWWVGYLETSSQVYFFATRLVLPTSENDDDFGNCRKTITYEVFKNLGIIY